jgi:hypothetical protein
MRISVLLATSALVLGSAAGASAADGDNYIEINSNAGSTSNVDIESDAYVSNTIKTRQVGADVTGKIKIGRGWYNSVDSEQEATSGPTTLDVGIAADREAVGKFTQRATGYTFLKSNLDSKGLTVQEVEQIAEGEAYFKTIANGINSNYLKGSQIAGDKATFNGKFNGFNNYADAVQKSGNDAYMGAKFDGKFNTFVADQNTDASANIIANMKGVSNAFGGNQIAAGWANVNLKQYAPY